MKLVKQQGQFVILAATLEEDSALEDLVGSLVDVSPDQSPEESIETIPDCRGDCASVEDLSQC